MGKVTTIPETKCPICDKPVDIIFDAPINVRQERIVCYNEDYLHLEINDVNVLVHRVSEEEEDPKPQLFLTRKHIEISQRPGNR